MSGFAAARPATSRFSTPRPTSSAVARPAQSASPVVCTNVADVARDRHGKPEHGHGPRGCSRPDCPGVGERDERGKLADRDEGVHLRGQAIAQMPRRPCREAQSSRARYDSANEVSDAVATSSVIAASAALRNPVNGLCVLDSAGLAGHEEAP